MLELTVEVCKYFNLPTIINNTNMVAFDKNNERIFTVYEHYKILYINDKNGKHTSHNELVPYIEEIINIIRDHNG